MSQNKHVKTGIGNDLRKAISDLQSGPEIIRGHLTITPGHDYFWFLEFGTGPFYDTSGPYDDVIGPLEPPPEILAHEAAGQAYDINALGPKPLVYMTKEGQRRRRMETVHPGIHPIGFVRSAIFDAIIYLEQDFVRLKVQLQHGRRLPKRAELVALINYTLEVLLGTLRLTTPTDSDPDPYHADHRPHTPPLSQAWGISRAE